MRAVVQRVNKASVTVEGEAVSEIRRGILVLIGISPSDGARDIEYIAGKLVNLRIFEDDGGKMNRSLLDIGGEALIVSQFTLYADARGGRRPSFSDAAPGDMALPVFRDLVKKVSESGVSVKTGQYGAHMQVSLVNDGPVTLLLDSSRMF
jgi:D-tyrosyl-tRNA(Tyr) deacylase